MDWENLRIDFRSPTLVGGRTLFWLIAALAIVTEPRTSAESGVTNTLNGTTSSISSGLFVGSNGALNALILTNGGVLSVLEFAPWSAIGNTAISSNNAVTVTGAGSVWTNGTSYPGIIYIGNSGAFNRLTIANGGQVFSSTGYIGFAASAANNSAIISGSGSVWSNSASLCIGNYGSSNNLTIKGGATVFDNCNYGSGNLQIGAWSNNNSVLVTGDASKLIAVGGSVLVGNTGSFNTLTVADGGRVATLYGYAVYVGYDVASSNNSLVVTGGGSVLTNDSGGSLYLGWSGSGNSLTISNGGQVFDSGCSIGFFASSTNNWVLVDGPGSVWNNKGSLEIGTSGGGNTMIVTNGGVVISHGWAGVDRNQCAAIVTGSGSLWSNDTLYIGSYGFGDTLTIANGGQVFNTLCYLGFSSGDSNNAVTVTGAGSIWNNSSTLYVGNSGSSNRLVIANGGSVVASNVIVSKFTTAAENQITVSSGSLMVTNAAGTGALDIRNGALVLNSGTVIVNQLYLTNNASSVMTFNAGLLQSGGTLVSNGVTFVVGDGLQSATLGLTGGASSFANGLRVNTNAALVSTGTASLASPTVLNAGQFSVNGGTLSVASAFTNAVGGTFTLNAGTVLVPLQMNNQGAFIQNGGLFDPLVFTNSGSFVLNSGTNMDVTFLNLAGATVLQTGGEHDVNVATNPGTWTITGGTANLTNFNDLGTLVLSGGVMNVSSLLVTNGANSVVAFNGGTLASGGTVISNGSAFVVGDTGGGAALNLLGGTNRFYNDFVVGNSGSANSLLITNGAQAWGSGYGIVGNNGSGSNNTVVVAGAGSAWTNRYLYIGCSGSGNSLTIANAGGVSDVSGYIGYNPGAGRNAVVVTDAGSRWSNNFLFVGYSGSSNSLTIANGGTVNGGVGFVGHDVGASNNAVVVTGAGSCWSNGIGNTLYSVDIGYNGSFNSLSIANSGRVVDSSAYIGDTTGASNNVVQVTGPGSVWTNSDTLYVGSYGAGNGLVVTNGGQVFDKFGQVGGGLSADNNSVLVSDPGSVWYNSSVLTIGAGGSSNTVTIANGGRLTAATYSFIGDSDEVSNNLVLITDPGSIWNIGTWFYLAGQSNRLMILNGGSLVAGGSAGVGSSSYAYGNSLLASTTGCVASLGLFIGNMGSRSNNVTLQSNTYWNLCGGRLTWGSGAGAFSNTLVIDATSALTNIYGLTLGDNNTTYYMTNSAAGLVLNSFTTNQLQFSNGFGGLTVNAGGAGTTLIISNYTFSAVGLTLGASGGRSNSVALMSNSVGNLGGGALVLGSGAGAFGNSLTIDASSALTNIYGLTLGNNNNTYYMTNSAAGLVFNDFTTNQLQFSNGFGILTVGAGCSNVALVISNYQLNAFSGYVGNSGSNNSALVTGPGAVWSNSSGLMVGSSGFSNSLAITNGGQVFNNYGFVGYSSGASLNAVMITGNGSVWSNNSTLFVGYYGSSNNLTMAGGGQVFGSYGQVGNYTSSVNNSVWVSGTGSLWFNSNNVIIGVGGSANSLVISNGGQVMAGGGSTIGNGSTSSNNSVLVTGAGSLWNNSGSLCIGYYGSSNSLTITNGGTVLASNLTMGASPSTGNVMIVSGGWLGVSNAAGLGALNVNYGTLNLNSGTVTVDWLIVTNGVRSVVSFNGGTLNSSRTLVRNGSFFQVGNGVSVATLNVTGGTNTFANGLLVSSNAVLSSLANLLSAPNLTVNASGMAAINGGRAAVNSVTNAGLWTLATGGTLEVRNDLTVTSTGALTNFNDGDLRLVSNATLSVSGSLVITNATLEFAGASTNSSPYLAGVTFQNGSTLRWAGYNGSFGSHVLTGNLNLDLAAGAGALGGIVDNAGLTLGGGSLYVGITNSGDSLLLTNGGTVWATNVVVGSSTSTGNVVTVSGGFLDVTNTARSGVINVLYGTLNLNSGTVAVNRLVLTNGANSVFNFNGGVLQADQVLSAQALAINGGTLSLADSFVNSTGGTFQLNSGGVIVPGSMANQGTFVQNGGLFDPLVFTNTGSFVLNGGTNVDVTFLNLAGATVLQTGGEHDVNTATNAGTWTITGGTANLTNFNDLGTLVLSGGVMNVSSLVVTNVGSLVTFNGGTLNSGGTVVSNGSAFVVGDSGSGAALNLMGGTHSFSNGLTVGNNASGNSLLITNGGLLASAGYGVIGNSAMASNNLAAIAGHGSLWNCSSDFYIGNTGSWNQLTVSMGGILSTTNNYNPGILSIYHGFLQNSYSAFIGLQTDADFNSAVISGAGSVWSNYGLCVGYGGSFNQLTITNGGSVNSVLGNGSIGATAGISIGDRSSASNNAVYVSDSGSALESSGHLFVGYAGSGNRLIITNGAQASSIAEFTYNGVSGYYMVVNATQIGNTGNDNEVQVSGVGSMWSNTGPLYVGYDGDGNSLSISGGGQVLNSGPDQLPNPQLNGGLAIGAVMGYTSNANNNSVSVSGPGSLWSNSFSIYAGLGGSSNSLTVVNGGQVVNSLGFMGYYSYANNNTALVSGIGSLWNNTNGLYVGFTGSSNVLTVADGGTVAAPSVIIGYSNSIGNLIVVSGGSLYATNTTASGTLNVNYGTLNFNSGTVMVNQLVVANGSNSVVTFNGGTLASGGSTVNNGSIFRVGDGASTATLDLLGGTHSYANGLLINTNATLTGTGAITGSITDYGLIAPGNGLGVITDVGDLTLLSGSAFSMELGGTNSALYDQFDLTGSLAFAGALNVALVNGYTVQSGDWFNLFDFTSSSGSFGSLNLPTLAASLYWNTNALYTTGILEADTATGSVQVALGPQAAIDAGARWQIDSDGNWHTNNETISGLIGGSHTLSYTNLTGWIAPGNQTIQISQGTLTTTSGTYQLTPMLLASVSRKTHGSSGTFDVKLSLGGTPTVEPRVSGPTQLVFTFNKPMAAADGTLDATEFVLTNATFVSASIVTSNLTLNLTNVVDQSRITVVMNGLTDLSGNALSGTNAIIVRALFGDENQSGTVNVIDLQQTKNNLAAALTAANFLCDINCSGTINVIDLQQMKNSLTHTANGLVDAGGSGGSGGASTSSLLVTGADTGATNTVTALGTALGATNLVWSTGGDAGWTATTAEDGTEAVWSGKIGDLNVSWMEATVTGTGTVSFEWMVSSDAGGDTLGFAIDGVEQTGAISGEVGWQTVTYTVPAGTHRLTWTYSKNGLLGSGLDAGWVRRVKYSTP